MYLQCSKEDYRGLQDPSSASKNLQGTSELFIILKYLQETLVTFEILQDPSGAFTSFPPGSRRCDEGNVNITLEHQGQMNDDSIFTLFCEVMEECRGGGGREEGKVAEREREK